MISPKPGDSVKHRPSGETWVVAWADPATDQLVPCGWPLCIAKLSDCDLDEVVTVDVAKEWAKRVAASGEGIRSRGVKRLYPELFT
jgi:hypothetical protein